ncbi:MAG TPA: hypothetical protein VEJ38_11530 [Candidatus Acidoferrales bacterium]|nr:hypothetical protein [Candidatus Acidoferrales bacterium]
MSRKFVLGTLALTSILTLAASGKRINLIPRYVPGETLRYRIESTTTTNGKTTTPIVNPEGGTHSTLTIHLVVRLDVLAAPSSDGSGAVRLRATYEKSSAESQSDALDPAQPSASDQYARLKGESVEFTIAPSGQLVDIKGLETPADRSVGQSALSWLGALSTAGGFPADGVEISQKWKSERPVEGAPLTGLAWRVESTYLRDEPCDSSPAGGPSAPAPKAALESCAVILSRFEISRSGAVHGDATPEDYLRNGLRTSGSWTGSGESLNYISLASGLLVRSIETSDQQMDYKITSAATSSSIARNAQVHSQSEISLDSTPSVAP